MKVFNEEGSQLSQNLKKQEIQNAIFDQENVI
jgi:hypothetical protein